MIRSTTPGLGRQLGELLAAAAGDAAPARPSGSPAAAAASTATAGQHGVRVGRRLEEPRSTIALPDFRHSAAASIVTFGRASYTTAITPSGTRTLRTSRPLGSREAVDHLADGIGAARRSSRTPAAIAGDPRRRRAPGGRSARRTARPRARPRGRARWPRGSRRRALDQRAGDRLQRGVLDARAERRQRRATPAWRPRTDLGYGCGGRGHRAVQVTRARNSPGGPPPRWPAAAARARRPTSARAPCAARRPSSCRSPCRPPAPSWATSTASPASNVPTTSTTPTGSRLVPPSRSARAAPASTSTRPRAGLAYLSHSLKLE